MKRYDLNIKSFIFSVFAKIPIFIATDSPLNFMSCLPSHEKSLKFDGTGNKNDLRRLRKKGATKQLIITDW